MDDGARGAAGGRVAVALAGLIALFGVLALALTPLQPAQDGLAANVIACFAGAVAFAPVGVLVIRRRGNPVGWLLLVIGLGLTFSTLSVQYSVVAATGALDLPAWRAMMLAGGVTFLVTGGAVILLCLLFPTGTLPGPRWRHVRRLFLGCLAAGTVLALFGVTEQSLTESEATRFANPLAVDAVVALAPVLGPVVVVTGLLAALACIGSLVGRYRRGTGADRVAVVWLATVVVTAVLFMVLGQVAAGAADCSETCGDTVFYTFFAGLSVGIPVAVGGAILRRGLYDIEVVVRRTVVLAALGLTFMAVYAGVVGGLGALLHDPNNPVLSFTAAALVALASQPLLERARRFADVLVYGRRATPYEVLARFSDSMGETRSHDAVLAEMARVVAEGTGALESGVWLRLDGELRRAARWPGQDDVPPVPLVDDGLPPLPGDVAAPVVHDGELLGALTLTMPASEPATEATRTLVADLAGQAGLVLRNVRLIEELRASRRRLVAAQDDERRRLERNLHDGAQQQLIALRLRLRLADAVADDPDAVRKTLDELGAAAQDALDDLRDLARGIYPPLLAERGLPTALEAQARRSVVDVRVDCDGVGRYPQETEAAVYFCTLEALQNVAKYAKAQSVSLTLRQDGGDLTFSVIDDGAGFDARTRGRGTGLQGMADRLAALGGSLEVSSAPGDGTTVSGRLPAPRPPGAAASARAGRTAG